MPNCEGCGRPSHREWTALDLPNCGRKRCLVRMVVRRAGFPVGQFGPAAVATDGLNQFLKTGYLRSWGWRYALPAVASGDLIRGLAGEVKRCEELENAGVPVPVAEFSRRLQDLAQRLERMKAAGGTRQAGAEVPNRAKIALALSSVGTQLPSELDNTQYSISATQSIVRAVMEKAGKSPRSAEGGGRFVGGIFAFAASDLISHMIGSEFEIVSSIAKLSKLAALFDLVERISVVVKDLRAWADPSSGQGGVCAE